MMVLLNLDKVEEPFDLETALSYMRKNKEFIRCLTSDQDFYMYLEEVKRPVIKDGKRQLVSTETVWAFNQWGGMALTLNLSDLIQKTYYLMRFDASGNPDWTPPTKHLGSEGNHEGIDNNE